MADWLIGEDGGLVMDSGFVYEPGSTSIASPSKNLMFNFEELGEMRGSGSLHPSVVNGENLIGLRLGKRTYFEDTGSVSTIAARSSKHEKKTRSSSSNGNSSRCQVEGCNLDLSSAKDYHRRHRVCESHTKSPKVIVAGLERRFCQQCSRFHGLAEFDENKRSCRRRLSDHNARRRKPQPEAIQLPPSLYDGRGHLNLAMNRVPLFQTRSANPPWEDVYDSGFFQLHQLQLADTLALPSRLCASSMDVSHQGYGGSPGCSAVDSAQDLRRALSLLSTSPALNCRGLECVQELPLAPPATWRSHHHSGHGNLMSSDGGQFPEFQLFKPPYEPDFCSNYRMN